MGTSRNPEDILQALLHGCDWLARACVVLVLSAGCAVGAELQIVASGLFEGRALLSIDGVHRLLRTGETSPEGVKLLAADSREALIELGGRRLTLTPGRVAGGGFEVPSRREVAIARDARRQYAILVTVNGRQTRAVVDTGASVVALNSVEAQRLGIDYQRRGVSSMVRTAGGVVPAWSLTLDRVETAGIVVHHVAAAVVEGDHPTEMLLGMSWLGQVTMREADGVLYLGEK